MNFVDAFLWVTTLTYFAAVFLSEKFLKNLGFFTQKLVWIVMGTVWVLCLLTTYNLFQWLALGVIYVIAALLSYVGMLDWGSKPHNLFMAVWDLLLAVICLSKF